MTTAKQDIQTEELPLEALILQCKKDKYKLSYSAIRWAKEIKKTESLPDPVPLLIPRALREILTGKVKLKEVEKLAPMAHVPTPSVQAPAPAAPTPTITLNVQPEKSEEAEAAPEPEAEAEPEKSDA